MIVERHDCDARLYGHASDVIAILTIIQQLVMK